MTTIIVGAGIIVLSLLLAGIVGYGQGMADAPSYDNTPLVIAGAGGLFGALIIVSHWLL